MPYYPPPQDMAIGNPVILGTYGSVLFVDTSGLLGQDNANFFWDDTNNRLGIGTTAPSLKFTISASATSPSSSGAVANGFLHLSATNGEGLAAGVYSTTPFGSWIQASNVNVAGTVRPLVLQPIGGGVAIGNTSNVARLIVSGDSNSLVMIGSAGITNFAGIKLNGTDSISSTNYNFLSGATDLNLYYNVPTGLSHKWRIGNFQGPMELNVVGLAIGTQGSSFKLNVYGTAQIVARLQSTNSDARLEFKDADTTADSKVFVGSDRDDLELWAGGSDMVRINSLGAVGFGGENYGSAGQVLTSSGSNLSPVWANATTGGGANGTTYSFPGNIQVDSPKYLSIFTGGLVTSSTSTKQIYDVFTVSDGKLANVLAFSFLNNSTAGLNAGVRLMVKTNGTYYPLNNIQTTSPGTVGSQASESFIAAGGETLAVELSAVASSIELRMRVVEYDTSTNVRSYKVYNPVSGNNLIYTSSLTSNAIFLSQTMFVEGVNSNLIKIFNGASGSVIYYVHVVPSGQAINSKYIFSSSSTTASMSQFQANGNLSISSGTYMSFYCSSQANPQVAWINVVEN